MKRTGVAFIIGAIVGIPLTSWLGLVGSMITLFVVSFIISASTTDSPKRAKVQRTAKNITKEDEELVSVILPTIHKDK